MFAMSNLNHFFTIIEKMATMTTCMICESTNTYHFPGVMILYLGTVKHHDGIHHYDYMVPVLFFSTRSIFLKYPHPILSQSHFESKTYMKSHPTTFGFPNSCPYHMLFSQPIKYQIHCHIFDTSMKLWNEN